VPLVAAYFRPDSLDEALSLLAEPNRIPLAGGTGVNADREPSALEVVDLQDLGLDGIEADGDRVRIGATATLDDLTHCRLLPGALRDIARREAPSTLRTLSTVGGTVAAGDSESVILAALLTGQATVEMAGAEDLPLEQILTSGIAPGAIIIAVTLDPTGTMATASTARTPADVPIVAAVARRSETGDHLALTGMAPTPILVNPANPTEGLNPPADFRGTGDYRRRLAAILSARAVEALS